MLLVRHIDRNTPKDSSLYRLLDFYLRTHFDLYDNVAVTDYIEAIVNNDVTRLIKGILTYRPVKAYDIRQEYESIAKTLISA